MTTLTLWQYNLVRCVTLWPIFRCIVIQKGADLVRKQSQNFSLDKLSDYQAMNMLHSCLTLGSTEIWTQITGFKVQSANNYTMEPHRVTGQFLTSIQRIEHKSHWKAVGGFRSNLIVLMENTGPFILSTVDSNAAVWVHSSVKPHFYENKTEFKVRVHLLQTVLSILETEIVNVDWSTSWLFHVSLLPETTCPHQCSPPCCFQSECLQSLTCNSTINEVRSSECYYYTTLLHHRTSTQLLETAVEQFRTWYQHLCKLMKNMK